MMEWEKLKKEYREVPVPAEGSQQVLQAIAKAKQKRNRITGFAKYGTVAAAALLVLLLPGMLLLSNGFGGSKENSSMMEADSVTQSVTEGGWLAKSDRDNVAMDTNSTVAEEDAKYSYNATGSTADSLKDESRAETEAEAGTEMVLWSESREPISKEILRQMEERMQNKGETYYIKSGEYPEGFELLATEQEYYINAEGLLVVVFDAGLVAPKEQGTVEFVIPAEVFQP